MAADLTAALTALDACKDEEWLVYEEKNVTVDLGKYVSLRACLGWIQRLARLDWRVEHLLRLQALYKTLLSKATHFDGATVAPTISYDSRDNVFGINRINRLDMADCIAAAPKLKLQLYDAKESNPRQCALYSVTVTQLLLNDDCWAQFERSWSELHSVAVCAEEASLPRRAAPAAARAAALALSGQKNNTKTPMAVDLTAALKKLAACKDEEWLVFTDKEKTVTCNLGKYVSLRACIGWIQRLAQHDWTMEHLLRLQHVFRTLLAKATYVEKSGAGFMVVGCDSSPWNSLSRVELADCVAAASEIQVALHDSQKPRTMAKVTIHQLLLINYHWAEFERFWSELPSAAVHREQAPFAVPTAESIAESAADKSAAPIVEEKSAAPDAWLRLRACKRVAFALRCPQPFVDWANGQTFAGVELDWVEFNERVAEPIHATQLIGDRWSARLCQLGIGASFANNPLATYGFVCADFQLPRYAAALEAAWRAYSAEHSAPEALRYALGSAQIQPVCATPLIVITAETPADWLEWHADLGKAPELRDRDYSTAWLAELHKLIKDKAPLDRVRFIGE